MLPSLEKILKKSSNPEIIKNAFSYAQEAYKEKRMPSGENYIYHALRVTEELNRMNVDSLTLAFGLLHDVMDDKTPLQKQIEFSFLKEKFGEELASLVFKISELRKIRYPLEITIKEKRKAFSREKLEKIKRMFLALAGDVRVILVELISRLDGLNFVTYLPEEKQKIHCLETLQIFVPLAGRLGLNELRRRLEDTVFSQLFPQKFEWLKENIKEEYSQRENYLRRFIPFLQKILRKEKIKFTEINFRAKSYWSTYKKVMRYEMDFKKVHDLLALRIITSDIPSCYKTLGVLHKYFKPLTEEINDYIAKPKPNGYRSLHTIIVTPENKIIEVQIRTEEMHKEAEYGICAHWAYKEKIKIDNKDKDFRWLNQTPYFWKNFQIDFYPHQVFTFTPKGDIIVLPKGSTPVDFAYALHTEIGNKCESAKINGKIASLDSPLSNGDIVEIITKRNKFPSKDWLTFVKTPLARSQIKKFTQEKPKTLKIPLSEYITRKITKISEFIKKKKKEKEVLKKEGLGQIYIGGQKGVLTQIAKCCQPRPGDEVGAYLTHQRIIVLHLKSCENFQKLIQKHPEKVLEASWKEN